MIVPPHPLPSGERLLLIFLPGQRTTLPLQSKAKVKGRNRHLSGWGSPTLVVKRKADLGLSNKRRFDRPRRGEVKTGPRQPPPARTAERPEPAAAPRHCRQGTPHRAAQPGTSGKTPGQPARTQSAESGDSQDRPPRETDTKVRNGA